MSIQARIRLELGVLFVILLVAIVVIARPSEPLPSVPFLAEGGNAVATCYGSACDDYTRTDCDPGRKGDGPCTVSANLRGKLEQLVDRLLVTRCIGPAADCLDDLRYYATALFISLGISLLLLLILVVMLYLVATGRWTTSGNPGEGGLRGPQGPAGDKGLPGDKGEQGLRGEQGPRGESGSSALFGRLSDGVVVRIEPFMPTHAGGQTATSPIPSASPAAPAASPSAPSSAPPAAPAQAVPPVPPPDAPVVTAQAPQAAPQSDQSAPPPAPEETPSKRGGEFAT